MDKDGNDRSVHLADAVRAAFHERRNDGVLPTVVAMRRCRIVLADGGLLAPEGLDRLRGIQFIIQDELRAIVPKRKDCTPERGQGGDGIPVRRVAGATSPPITTGKANIIAAALTMIERSLLPERPCFFVTAGRRGGGKTTTLTMLIMAVTGLWPAAAAWSTNEEERRKALMSYFLYGVSYILWDNIARGTQISCPHIEKSCTVGVLCRPQARRERNGLHRSVDHPHFHRQQYRRARATWLRAACKSASTSTAPTPRTGRSSIPTRSAGPRTTAPRSWRRSTPSCSAIPSSKRARRRGQDPVQDVVAAGWLGGRARRQAARHRAGFPEAVRRRRRRTTRNRPRWPTCLRSW